MLQNRLNDVLMSLLLKSPSFINFSPIPSIYSFLFSRINY